MELASLSQFRLGSIEPAQRRLAVRHHRGEWLIHLVRDQGGKFSQHRDAGGVCEVRLQLLKCRLGTSALGDVDEADKADFELVGPSEIRALVQRTSMTRPSRVATLVSSWKIRSPRNRVSRPRWNASELTLQ